MLILAFVHALELKLHNIGKLMIDLRDLSPAPLTRAPHRGSCTGMGITDPLIGGLELRLIRVS